MLFLAQKSFRVVAHDRRGHGRSSQPSTGNDMDGYTDDLAAVIDALDLRDVTAIPPAAAKSPAISAATGPGVSPRRSSSPRCHRSCCEPRQIRKVFRWRCSTACSAASPETARNSTRIWLSCSMAPTGPARKVSQGTLDQFWLWSMQAGLKNAYDCIKAFSETDFTEDLSRRCFVRPIGANQTSTGFCQGDA